MKKREKSGWKTLVIFWVVCLLIVAVAIAAYEIFAPTKRLARLGYTPNEIELVTERLDKDGVNTLLDYDYDARITEILQEPSFRVENLTGYIERIQRSDFNAQQIMSLVNHRDYNAETDYSTLMLEILLTEYYVSPNMERYFDYISTYNKVDNEATDVITSVDDDSIKAQEIVELVNHNRDREFYTEPIATDVTQEELMLVNKYYMLDKDFVVDVVALDAAYGSSDVLVERETYKNFQAMYDAALADGIQPYVTSGYRGYDEQEEVFASYLTDGGMEHALKYAAKPGFSEHQTGRALDIFAPGTTLSSFAGTPTAKWLENHAHEFGFILRYPLGKENLTGYSYEAWHYRYVGKDVAKYIFEHGITLEQYYVCFVENNISEDN